MAHGPLVGDPIWHFCNQCKQWCNLHKDGGVRADSTKFRHILLMQFKQDFPHSSLHEAGQFFFNNLFLALAHSLFPALLLAALLSTTWLLFRPHSCNDQETRCRSETIALAGLQTKAPDPKNDSSWRRNQSSLIIISYYTRGIVLYTYTDIIK